MSYDLYASILVMHDEFRPTDAGVSLSVDFTGADLPVLRERFGLCAIAGEGGAFDRAMRVMDWLTTHVRHNGNCNPDGPRCALTALDFAFDQPEKGVNCAWLATTLTECLLALAIPARTVYIMPFAPYDCDNHVVTEVWTGETWCMLDPTCNCCALDENGAPLSVPALRAALAAQQEIRFSDGLRYNGQPYSHEQHRDYLAKDLCWMRMQEVSGQQDSRFVTLSPATFDPHRHQTLNVRYRLRVQGDQPWLRDWLAWLESTGANEVFCAPADAALPPKEVNAHE